MGLGTAPVSCGGGLSVFVAVLWKPTQVRQPLMLQAAGAQTLCKWMGPSLRAEFPKSNFKSSGNLLNVNVQDRGKGAYNRQGLPRHRGRTTGHKSVVYEAMDKQN